MKNSVQYDRIPHEVPTETVTFIPASAIFKGFDKLWDVFNKECRDISWGGASDISWGGANRTLADFGSIYAIIDGGTYEEIEPLFNDFTEKTNEIEPEMLVDLEN